jgi:hypothetical protein
MLRPKPARLARSRLRGSTLEKRLLVLPGLAMRDMRSAILVVGLASAEVAVVEVMNAAVPSIFRSAFENVQPGALETGSTCS